MREEAVWVIGTAGTAGTVWVEGFEVMSFPWDAIVPKAARRHGLEVDSNEHDTVPKKFMGFSRGEDRVGLRAAAERPAVVGLQGWLSRCRGAVTLEGNPPRLDAGAAYAVTLRD